MLSKQEKLKLSVGVLASVYRAFWPICWAFCRGDNIKVSSVRPIEAALMRGLLRRR